MKRQLFALIAVFVSLQCCAAQDSTLNGKLLAPESKHATIMVNVAGILSQNHYRPQPINDEFSAKVYHNYLDALDPNHLYFLQTDIDKLNRDEYQFDDYFKEGNAQPAFDIYNLFLQRVNERLQFVYHFMQKEPDYSAKAYYETDREKLPYATNVADLDKIWENKLKFECLSLKTTGKDFAAYSETIQKRYKNFEKQLIKTKSEDVFGAFMNSFTEIFDPHTNYFSPRLAEDFNMSMSLSLEGIGATLRSENDYTKVQELVKGGPAERSKKIKPNDRISAVAQGKEGEFVDVVGWRIDDVVALIRGPKGTVVKLRILPADAPANSKPKEIELVREKIKLEDQAAKGEVKTITRDGKKYNVGVVTLPTFYLDYEGQRRGDKDYKSTNRDVKRIIEGFKKDGIDGLVIDLRNNGGGSLAEAINLTGLFISSGPVVQVKDNNSQIDIESDRNPEVVYSGPLTVLVNRFSASASEIFAGAIQDYKRGVIIGENTYGKGTVQNMVDLNRVLRLPSTEKAGELKLTIAKFYRINGSSTQHKGVTPDIEFPSIFPAEEFGEDASPYALPWDQINSTEYTEFTDITPALVNTLKSNHDQRMKDNREYRYLAEDIAEYKRVRGENRVSVNENDFKKEQDQSEARRKKREEERKSGGEGDAKSDLILQEGNQVLLDLITSASK